MPSRAPDRCAGRNSIELKLTFDFSPPCITFYEYWLLAGLVHGCLCWHGVGMVQLKAWAGTTDDFGDGAGWLQETAALLWCLALTHIFKTNTCVCLKTPSSCFLWITSVLGKYWYSFSIITVSKTVARTVLDLEPNLLLLKSYSGPNSLLNWGDIFWDERFKVVFQKFHLEGWRNDVYSEQLGTDQCLPEHLRVAGIALNWFNCKVAWI